MSIWSGCRPGSRGTPRGQGSITAISKEVWWASRPIEPSDKVPAASTALLDRCQRRAESRPETAVPVRRRASDVEQATSSHGYSVDRPEHGSKGRSAAQATLSRELAEHKLGVCSESCPGCGPAIELTSRASAGRRRARTESRTPDLRITNVPDPVQPSPDRANLAGSRPGTGPTGSSESNECPGVPWRDSWPTDLQHMSIPRSALLRWNSATSEPSDQRPYGIPYGHGST